MSEIVDKNLIILKHKKPGNVCFISRYDEKGVLKSQTSMKSWANWETNPNYELVELENVAFVPELEGRRSRYTRYSGDTVKIRHPVYDVIFEIEMAHFFDILFKEGIDEGFQFRSSYYIKGTSGSITLIPSNTKGLSFYEGPPAKKKQINSKEATSDSIRRPLWFPVQKTYGYFFTSVTTEELTTHTSYDVELRRGASYYRDGPYSRDIFYLPEKKAYLTSSKDYYEVVAGLPIYSDVDSLKTIEAKRPYWIKDAVEICPDNILNMTYFPNWKREVKTSDGTSFQLFTDEALRLLETKSGIYYSSLSLIGLSTFRIDNKIYVSNPLQQANKVYQDQQRYYEYKVQNMGQKEADDWLAANPITATYLSSDPYIFKGDDGDKLSPSACKEKNAANALVYVKCPVDPYKTTYYYNNTGKPLDPAAKAAFEAAEEAKVRASAQQFEAYHSELQAMTPVGYVINDL